MRCADAGCDDGIEQARAIHVQNDIVFVRDRTDLFQCRQRPDAAAACIGGLFDGYQRRLGHVVAVGGADGAAHHISGENSRIAIQNSCHHARQCRRPAGFGMQDVAGLVYDHFLPGLGPGSVGDGIAHRAGRQEKRGLRTQHLASHFLQLVDGRVFVALLIADLGIGDGFAHPRRGLRFGVGIKINTRRGHGMPPENQKPAD